MHIVHILTYHYSNNVGAMLQAYGLVMAIEALGHKTRIIDYRPSSIRNICEGRYPRHPKKFLQTFFYRKRIRDFRNAYLPLTRTYLDSEEFRKYPPKGDFFVCGSDQIWNITSKRGFDPSYFLDFVKDANTKRISYAPSFGNGTELGIHWNKISKLLSRFDFLSVRDKISQEMVRSLIGKDAAHVLDPCFLTDYGPVTPRPLIGKPYILAYLFGTTEIAETVLNKLQEKMNIPIVRITTGLNTKNRFNPGPLQWLSLMKYADYVITNSFHGTCFSLINKRQFTVVPYDKSGAMSRIEDILENTGLLPRYVTDENRLKLCLQNEIDYEHVGERINSLRFESIQFLENALKT